MHTCYYTLDPALALRGFPGHPYTIVRYADTYSTDISGSFMDFLKRCNGTEAFFPELMFEEMRADVERCIRAGIITEHDEPCPIHEYQNYRSFDHQRKIVAQWSITGRCNLKCRHCFIMSANAEKGLREYSLEEAEMIVRELSDYGVESVMITGGEPLLHPHFLDIVRLIIGAGMKLSWINTNGMLLTEKLLDNIEALGAKPKMAISFDGYGTHDWMRNCPGAEQKALDAIKMCADRKLETRACVNMNRRTLPRLVETVKDLAGMGVSEVFLLRTTEAPRWVETLADEPELELSLKEYVSMIPELTETFAPEIENGLRVKFFGIVNVDKNTPLKSTLREYAIPASESPAWCAKTHNGVFITSDGYVVPCDGFEGGSRDSGMMCEAINILHHPLAEIYASPEYERFGVSLTAEDIRKHSPECADCDKWKSCYGGKCRVNALVDGFRENGNYFCDPARRDVGACIFKKVIGSRSILL